MARNTTIAVVAVLGAVAALVGLLVVRDTSSSSGSDLALPRSMAALGDSITAGYNACGLYRDCPERSWSTGTDPAVNSLYLRLLARNPAIEGHAVNLAQSGAKAVDTPVQARAAADAGAEYVTILIGANDACTATEADMTPVQQFRASIDEAFNVLGTAPHRPDLFISSIPDVYRLWETERADPAAALIWGVGGVCGAMLANPSSDSTADVARRARVRARIVELNEQLAMACAAYGPGCNYDGGAVFEQRFNREEVSGWDHFHPSERGQATLAAIASASAQAN
jgi:lysophospholipase L1-like esterase